MNTTRRRTRQPSGFVPERLIKARQARGLSQTSLASLTGILKQSISSYESGRQAPREEGLDVLVSKLGFPRSYFFKPILDTLVTPIHFRSLAKTTLANREQVTSRLLWIEDMLSYLDEYLEKDVSLVPDYGKCRHPTTISYDEIEQIATNVRRDFELKDGPISNVTWLLQNQGILLVRMTGAELESEDLDAFSTWLKQESVPAIILSARKSTLCRERMNLAHELGHLVLHRGISPTNREEHKLMESQAFRFGSAFLLPETTYFKSISYPSLDAFLSVKSRWKVSIKAQIERCYRANIISDERRRLLYMQCSRKGWSIQEPLDDEMPLENPTYLSDSLRLLVDENIADGPSIVEAMSLDDTDISSFTGLSVHFFRGNEKRLLTPKLRIVKK